jgi:uncharacterized protein YdaU (DUF1376 family)
MSDYWYAFNSGAYAKKTATLSMIEHGAYRLLLDHYYNVGPGMEANATGLLRVCRAFAPDEQAAVQSILDKFFELRDGMYYNHKADKELDKRSKLRKIRAEAGAKGGASTRANASAKAKANEGQLPTQLQTQLHPSLPRKGGKEGVVGTPAQKNSAVEPSTEPGWEAQYPTWARFRSRIGDKAWAVWFANLTCVDETTIACKTPFQLEQVQQRYGAELAACFLGDVTFVISKPEKSVAKAS